MKRSQSLYEKAKKIIPGGTQLLSKRPEMFLPGLWPAYYKKAEGCAVWDMDGRRYTDMSYMGIGSCILGYADKDVDRSVKKAIDMGSMSTLNCYEEVELAELLRRIHPWADMVRYARTGGEAMAVAVRIARAGTGKDLILFCGYHGWHDWYLSSNLADKRSLDGHLLPGLDPAGVPRALKGTAIPFKYNDIGSFLSLMKKHKGSVAAVVMEPVRNHYPQKGFLETVRTETRKAGAVLIFDEVSSGWRLNAGGAHMSLGVDPDMAVFSKGISNGFPMAAVIGRKRVMESAQDTFISSTYWTERIGPAAALATIKKLIKKDVPRHLMSVGKEVQDGWRRSAARRDLKIIVSGIYPLSHFSFDHKDRAAMKTVFIHMMLNKGFLASTALYSSYAHKKNNIDEYLTAVDETFYRMSRAVKTGNLKKYLKCPVCFEGFKRLI